MTELLQFDQEIFHLINGEWHNSFMDAVMPWWRDKRTWIPLYLLIAGWVFYRYRLRGLYFIIAAGLAVGVADQTSSELVKKSVQRVRPCNDMEMREDVKLLVPCGGGYSFTSSHAANHFALAVFLALTLGRINRWIRLPLVLWAATVAFGQVYVGVHYPLDILCGALLGGLIGYLAAKLYLSLEKIRIAAFTGG